MSATVIKPRKFRIQRSELAVPATSENFFEKAAKGNADFIFLDLEDAVQPEKKEQARKNAIAALNEVDWGTKTMVVRINGLDTPWCYRDIVDIVEQCERPDIIMIPKVGTSYDVRFVDTMLSQIEMWKGSNKRFGIEVLIETALGMTNVEEIAASSDRLEAMIFGVGDYSITMRSYDRIFGAANPQYCILTDPDENGERKKHWNDQWHFALARIANACRAYGMRPIGGPYVNFSDKEGFYAAARRAAALGFEGNWAIHPSQVEIANEVFTPSEDEVSWARNVLCAHQKAKEEGRGAFALDGKLIDMAHIKVADNLLERAEKIAQLGMSVTE